MDPAFPATADLHPPSTSGQDLRRTDIHPDHWFPLAWSREVKPGHTLATHFAGRAIVLVRPRQGALFALEDRCAHRQVPLSQGKVEGCAIRCGYHGWRYDSTGHCTDVPYLGKDKLPNGVRTYPVHEAHGVIMVFPGNPALAACTPHPLLAASGDHAFLTRRFGQVVKCHYTFMHENLMDMNHQFLHRKQMGQIRPRFIGQDMGPESVEAQYSFARTGGKQPWGEAAIFGQKRGLNSAMANREVMTIRTEYPYQTLRIQGASGEVIMDLWIAYVPQDKAQRTNRTFGLLSVRKPRIPGLLHLAWPLLVLFTERIFKEDRDIVEMEQAAYDAQGKDLNQEVFPVIQNLRQLLLRRGVAANHPIPPESRPESPLATHREYSCPQPAIS